MIALAALIDFFGLLLNYIYLSSGSASGIWVSPEGFSQLRAFAAPCHGGTFRQRGGGVHGVTEKDKTEISCAFKSPYKNLNLKSLSVKLSRSSNDRLVYP